MDYAASGFFFAVAAKTAAALNVPSIACTGHRAVQMPHPIHFSWSMVCSWFSSPEGAFTGHTFKQIWQPVQWSFIEAFDL
jgi:hypothetical protein